MPWLPRKSLALLYGVGGTTIRDWGYKGLIKTSRKKNAGNVRQRVMYFVTDKDYKKILVLEEEEKRKKEDAKQKEIKEEMGQGGNGGEKG